MRGTLVLRERRYVLPISSSNANVLPVSQVVKPDRFAERDHRSALTGKGHASAVERMRER